MDSSTLAASNTEPADSLPGLLPHHLAELRNSGLSDATISAAGIYSEDNYERLASLLNWGRVSKRMAPALVFPFVNAEGQNGYSRIKPDTPRKLGGKPIKYESPRGRSNEIYLPPGVAEVLNRGDAELLLTEGEKKALKATQEGFPCIGLVGVYGWKDGKSERLLPPLERIKWRDRQVRIVFDSDAANNPNVREAQARLAKLLVDGGAVVRVAQLPSGIDSDGKPVKVGLDDFLVAHGSEALRKLLGAAQEPEPLDSVEMKVAASELDFSTEAKEFLSASQLDGVFPLRFWRGTWWYWRDGCYREIANSEVRSVMIRHLDNCYFKLGIGTTNNVLDHLKARTELGSRIEPPSWMRNHQQIGRRTKYWSQRAN